MRNPQLFAVGASRQPVRSLPPYGTRGHSLPRDIPAAMMPHRMVFIRHINGQSGWSVYIVGIRGGSQCPSSPPICPCCSHGGFSEPLRGRCTSGLRAVEYLFPYPTRLDGLRTAERHRLTQVLFNLPAGNWRPGSRTSLPSDRTGSSVTGVARRCEYARTLRCSQLNCLAGLAAGPFPREGARHAGCQCRVRRHGTRPVTGYVSSSSRSSRRATSPGFFLTQHHGRRSKSSRPGFGESGRSRRVPHAESWEGDLACHHREKPRRHRHIRLPTTPQAGTDPGRGDTLSFLLSTGSTGLGYAGWIGCELQSLPATTEAGLGWLRPYKHT